MELRDPNLNVNFAKFKKKNPAPPTQQKPVPTFNFFIANLPFEAMTKDLRELFILEGWDNVSPEIIFHDSPRRSSGYGFVFFKYKKVAEAAISTFQGKIVLKGRTLSGDCLAEEADTTKQKRIWILMIHLRRIYWESCKIQLMQRKQTPPNGN